MQQPNGQFHAGKSEVTVRRPAHCRSPVLHNYQAVTIGESKILVAELGMLQ